MFNDLYAAETSDDDPAMECDRVRGLESKVWNPFESDRPFRRLRNRFIDLPAGASGESASADHHQCETYTEHRMLFHQRPPGETPV